MKPDRKQQCIAELFLWEVVVSYVGFGCSRSVVLWITTVENNLSHADGKTKRVLRNRKAEFPNATIKAITSRGTLDA